MEPTSLGPPREPRPTSEHPMTAGWRQHQEMRELYRLMEIEDKRRGIHWALYPSYPNFDTPEEYAHWVLTRKVDHRRPYEDMIVDTKHNAAEARGRGAEPGQGAGARASSSATTWKGASAAGGGGTSAKGKEAAVGGAADTQLRATPSKRRGEAANGPAQPAGKRAKCEHGRRGQQCKQCGGSAICEHQRQRNRCRDCQAGKVASTDV